MRKEKKYNIFEIKIVIGIISIEGNFIFLNIEGIIIWYIVY